MWPGRFLTIWNPGVIKGAVSLLLGMRLLVSEAGLRAVLWRMIFLLVVLMLLLTGGVYWLAGYVASMWLPEGDAWYWQLVSWFVWLLTILLALVSGVVSYSILASAVAAPWLDELAGRTEALAGIKVSVVEAPWHLQILQSLANSIRPLAGLFGMGCVALLCLLVPVLGHFLAVVIWSYAGVRFLNFELMDAPASRRDWDFVARKSEQNARRFYYLGFGGMALVLMLVPVVNLLVIPAAVVALSRSIEGTGS